MLRCSVVSDSFATQRTEKQPNRLHCPQNSPGKNTGVGCCFVLQVIFLTQGSNLPGIEPVSPASLALAGGFFTTSATWETLEVIYLTNGKKDLNQGLLRMKHFSGDYAAG